MNDIPVILPQAIERQRCGLMQIRGGADWVDPAAVRSIRTHKAEPPFAIGQREEIPPRVVVHTSDGCAILRRCASMAEAESLAAAIAGDVRKAMSPAVLAAAPKPSSPAGDLVGFPPPDDEPADNLATLDAELHRRRAAESGERVPGVNGAEGGGV